MSKLRTRSATVGLGLFIALAISGALLSWASSFTTTMVHDQLAAQKIAFPPKGSPELDPQKFPGLQRYAGQAVDTGPEAKAFADEFIAVHLKTIGGGKTYSEISAASLANPSDQKLGGQAATMFRGETLRGLLLSAWGWSVVGRIAGITSYGAFAAALALVALGALGLARARVRQPRIDLRPHLATSGLTA